MGWLTRSAEPNDYDGMKWTTLGKYVGLACAVEVEAALQGDEAWEVLEERSGSSRARSPRGESSWRWRRVQ